MTGKEEYEVKKFLEAKGLSEDAVEDAMRSIEFHENTKELRGSKEVSRARECIDFKPNPGKATLTQVGETQTYLGGDDHGLPIYQEDVDMIKKSTPLAKKLVEIRKTKPQESMGENTLRTLRDTIDEVYDINPKELNMGPDTTENIHEIAPDETPDNVKRVPGIVKQAIQKSREIKENEETPDVMWYFDPESERFKPAVNLETQGLKFEPREQWEENLRNVSTEVKPGFWEEYYRKKKTPEIVIDDKMYPSKEAVDKAMEECNKNVSQDKDKIKESFEKTQEANICMGICRDEEMTTNPFLDDITKYSYSSILKRMDDTHTRKNSDYGDAAYKGYKKFGDYYFMVQLHNKYQRLESLTIGNKTQLVEDESIDDTLLDLANYAVMYLESRHRND